MSAIPILENLNMNYAEILKARLEVVSSLPSGLSTVHLGYTVYYQNKLWVWDGYLWRTWDNLPWTYEDNVLDGNNPRQEATEFNATSQYLNTNIWNINLAEGYDDQRPRTLGTMHFIGSANDILDWQLIKGRRLVYTAKDGSWFNIKNLSPENQPANHKQIITATNTDLTEIVKAEFSYSHNFDAWLLVSFEKRQTNWFKRYSIAGTQNLPQSQFVGSLPESSSEGLPYNGFYEVHAFVEVREYESNGVTLAATFTPQTLELSASGNNWILVDKSGIISLGGPNPDIKWHNFALQGSIILYAESAQCGSRDINYRITLPNGVLKRLLGGYIHVEYLGINEGANCSD